MSRPDALVRARELYTGREWAAAYTTFRDLDRQAALAPEDVECLATAAYLTGNDAESAEAWARGHHDHLAAGRVTQAVRCAFWLAFALFSLGERARGLAWIERARRLLDQGGDCVEHGYVLLPHAFESLARGDARTAYAEFARAGEIAERFGDHDLAALARHSCGRVLIRLGETRDGVALLDEAMVAIEAGDVSPLVVGDVYCSVIEGCVEVFDLRRAQEWTAALTRWCESQPDMVAFRGQCLVRRAELLQLRGVWSDAAEEANRACEQLLKGSIKPAAGAAFYQRAELQRLRGEFAEADESYRLAVRYGRPPQPGLALMRHAQGQLDPARDMILGAAAGTANRAARARLLPALVEITLAAHDLERARPAADELDCYANELDATPLRAAAAQARGAVLLAEGNATDALDVLRHAWSEWQQTEVPYEAARVRVLIGLAYRSLGDAAAAEMELDAARWVFDQLGAVPDLTRVEALLRRDLRKSTGGLSAREVEVLRLVASGKSNRAIAAELFISERTVERHVSNIFNKLDVSSRTAAAAYAYQHRLI